MSNWHGEAAVGRTHEWYTPPSLFEAMGAIFDLDPAMPPQPVEGKRIPLVALEAHEGTAPVPWVPARRWYTPAEDVLTALVTVEVFVWRPADWPEIVRTLS